MAGPSVFRPPSLPSLPLYAALRSSSSAFRTTSSDLSARSTVSGRGPSILILSVTVRPSDVVTFRLLTKMLRGPLCGVKALFLSFSLRSFLHWDLLLQTI